MQFLGPPRAWREAPFGARVIALMATAVAVLVVVGVALALAVLLFVKVRVSATQEATPPAPTFEPLLNRLPPSHP